MTPISPDELISIKMLIEFGSLIAGSTALLTFIITHLLLSFKMKGTYQKKPENGDRFRLVSESRTCAEGRQEAEAAIMKILGRMEKRMALGNLVMRRLVEVNDKIQNDEIEKIEKDLGIEMLNRQFGTD